MESQRDIARYWLINLVFVVCAYLGLIFWLAGCWYLVSLALYPDGLELFKDRGPAKPPEQSGFDFPILATWTFISFNALAGMLCGYLLVRWSSPQQTLHAWMLAIALFATFLQAALDPNGVFPKWIIAVLMSAESIAVLLGAQLAIRRE